MRYVIGLSFAALVVWVLQATGLLMAFFVFLAVGAIPGTSISVSPGAMLTGLGLLSLGVTYWMVRQRPLQQIQLMKLAYHEQIAEVEVKQKGSSKVREVIFATAYQQSYKAAQVIIRRRKQQLVASYRLFVTRSLTRISRALQPVRMGFIAAAVILMIATKEIALWARPYLIRTAKWLRVQAGYSVKGTMLSAHKWSSLSKKVWASVALTLKRCNSLLKRGKSLWIRAAR